MGAIIDFFTAVGEFISNFGNQLATGVATVTEIMSSFPLPLVTVVLALISIYAVYAIVGRS